MTLRFAVGTVVRLSKRGIRNLADDADRFYSSLDTITGVIAEHRYDTHVRAYGIYPYAILWEDKITIIHSADELELAQRAKVVGNTLILEDV